MKNSVERQRSVHQIWTEQIWTEATNGVEAITVRTVRTAEQKRLIPKALRVMEYTYKTDTMGHVKMVSQEFLGFYYGTLLAWQSLHVEKGWRAGDGE